MKKTPKPITVNTGEEGRVTKIIDDFFSEIKEFILSEYHPVPHPGMFIINSGELAFSPNVVTNNRLTYLLYEERAVACVLTTRTEYNYIHYDFFRNLSQLDKL